mmetsp:Transcript_43911/g.121521  ORF Transcript_43911/g.121521 Transcript_43911/m.121521 type:complete len:235 (-) Transcript_43911:813-1517(-)
MLAEHFQNALAHLLLLGVPLLLQLAAQRRQYVADSLQPPLHLAQSQHWLLDVRCHERTQFSFHVLVETLVYWAHLMVRTCERIFCGIHCRREFFGKGAHFGECHVLVLPTRLSHLLDLLERRFHKCPSFRSRVFLHALKQVGLEAIKDAFVAVFSELVAVAPHDVRHTHKPPLELTKAYRGALGFRRNEFLEFFSQRLIVVIISQRNGLLHLLPGGLDGTPRNSYSLVDLIGQR